MMAAIATGKGSAILEKMPRPGRKIVITGKGRCNFTNQKAWQDFSTHIHPKSNILKSAFYALTPEELIRRFEQAGMNCVVERGERAFPASHNAMDVVDTLVKMVGTAGSKIVCDTAVTSVVKEGEKFLLDTSKGVQFTCDKLIITCGGLSYPGTGSDGAGHEFAKALGHKVTRLYPSLTALVPRGYKVGEKLRGHIDRSVALGEPGKKLMGRSIKNVNVEMSIDGQLSQSEFGDVDFTDGGLEGPIGFKLSRKAVIAIENGSRVAITIRFKEGAPLHFDIDGYVGYERAVVTAGGVSTDEIIPKTMESRLVPGLYFAGEVLDIDADTGGYNLHCAFATGNLAGQSAAK